MWTKLLHSVGFLAIYAFTLFLGLKQQQRNASNVRRSGTGIVSYGFSMTTMVLGFAQFSLLTGEFPTLIVVLLLFSASIGLVLNNILAAIAGFGSQREKIKVLSMIWGAQWGVKHPIQACLMLLIASVVVFVLPIIALYKFWKFPWHSQETREWTALLLLAVPQVIGALVGLTFITRIVLSEYVDADVRNSYLSGQFSNVIYATVALVFPVSILSGNARVLSWFPPGEFYWIAVSIPLLLFLIGGVLPYLIGILRHRAEVRSLLEWRKDWLKGVYKLAINPSAPSRTELFEEKLSRLNTAIEERTAQNQIIQLYEQIRVSDTPAPAQLPAAAAPATENAAASSQTSDPGSPTVVSSEIPTAITAAPGNPTAAAMANVRAIIEEHADKLPEWDVQFRDLDKLTDLQRSLTGSDPANIKDFVDAEIRETEDEITHLSPQKNAIVSALLTVLPGVGSFLFKTYQNEIMGLIRQLAPH